jgi:broad specificity phosphatase PhoE
MRTFRFRIQWRDRAGLSPASTTEALRRYCVKEPTVKPITIMSTRLSLIAHGATAATRAAAFPHDEPLGPASREKAHLVSPRLGRVDLAWTSPARRAVETAQALDVAAKFEARLADMDVGHWAGRSLAEIEKADPAGLALWLEDPASTPHGGESIVRLLSRVTSWLDEMRSGDGRVIAITHAAVIRAAAIAILDADPRSFWRIDIEPLSISRFHAHGIRWTVRSLNAIID